MTDLGNNFFTSSNDTASDEGDDDDEDEKDKDDDKDKDKDKDDDDESLTDKAKDKIGDLLPRLDIGDVVDDAKDKAKEKIDDAKDKAKEKFDELGNEFVDGLAEKLGIKDWYSMHVLTFCQGDFKGEKTDFNVTECSDPNSQGISLSLKAPSLLPFSLD